MKYKIKWLLYLLFFPIYLFAQDAFFRSHQKIQVGNGPEDIVIDSFQQRDRLLISCSNRRSKESHFKEIVSVEIVNDSVFVLPRLNEPANLYFNPHGIDIQLVNNTQKLYVVNHSKNGIDQVLIYKVLDTFIELEQIIEDQAFVSLNSVAAYKNGNFYVSNDASKKDAMFEKLFAARKSNIVFYDLSLQQSSIVLDKLAYANGLAIKNNTIFVSTTQKNDLLMLTIEFDGSLNLSHKLHGVKGMDNITIYDNFLLIPAHPKFLKFIQHMKNKEKCSPGEVYLFDYLNSKRQKIFYNNGSLISAPATALYYKGNMYIGQVFDDFLLKTPLFLEYK